jgi:hypothetical protein
VRLRAAARAAAVCTAAAGFPSVAATCQMAATAVQLLAQLASVPELPELLLLAAAPPPLAPAAVASAG